MCNQRTYERKQDYELINRLFHSTHNFTLLKQSATSAASADLCLKSHISEAGNWNENRIDKQLHETNANWVREEAPRKNNILKAVKDKRTGIVGPFITSWSAYRTIWTVSVEPAAVQCTERSYHSFFYCVINFITSHGNRQYYDYYNTVITTITSVMITY